MADEERVLAKKGESISHASLTFNSRRLGSTQRRTPNSVATTSVVIELIQSFACRLLAA
jgi:hypothetical protein